MRGKLFGWLAGLMPLAAQAASLPTVPQVLDVFERAGQGPTALIDGFGSLGFDVRVMDHTWSGGNAPGAGDYALVLDLWADQQPFATALCLSAGQQNEGQLEAQTGQDADAFANAGRQPYGAQTERRVICSYSLWNPEPELTPFIDAAAAWATAQIGPLIPAEHPYFVRSEAAVNPDMIGTGQPWAMQLTLIAGGDDASMEMRILIDFGADLS